MARKKTSRKTATAAGKVVSAKAKLKDPKLRIFVSILLLTFSFYLVLAFTSFYFSYEKDYSKLNYSWIELVTNADIEVENLMGKTGAAIANQFIHNWFGLASYSFVILCFIAGLKLLHVKNFPFGKILRTTVILGIWLSITLGYLFGDIYDANWGGAHGFYMSKWLNAFVGKVGTAFILIFWIFSFVLFAFPNTQRSMSMFVDRLSKISGLKLDWLKKIRVPEKVKSIFTPETDSKQKSNPDISQQDADGFIKVDNTKPVNRNSSNNVGHLNELTHKQEFVLRDNGTEEIESDNFTVVDKKSNADETEALITKMERDNELALKVIKNEDVKLDDDEINTELADYDPTLDLSNYQIPPIDMLEVYQNVETEVTKEELLSNKNKIVETLRNFKIDVTKIKAQIGPTITLYEIIPAPGVRISKIKNLEDDIALSLSALGIRIIAPMPGRGTIGIEVPNRKPEIVSMRSVIASTRFQNSDYELPIALGKTISNETYVTDLTKMPHLLVAGATGQGKSVGLNAIIASLLYKKHPSQLKFVFVDPKKVELTLYEKIERHFLAKLPDAEEAIITNNQQVLNTLASLNIEMDARYDLLKAAFVRNIKEYNTKFIARKLNPQNGHKYLPYIVLVVDEFADLIMTAGKEMELPIARLAQLARAVGIHLIVATQRPSTNIITGVIKANFPTRLAFKVASMVDSRTILDSPGANQLIGRGDMLITEGSDLIRLQCAFVDTPEIERITEYIGSQQAYPTPYLLPEYQDDDESGVSAVDIGNRDDLFGDAARIVVLHQQGSTSLIQRKLAIGYNRAGRIIDQLEAAGIVGGFEGSKARQVLIVDEQSLEQFLG